MGAPESSGKDLLSPAGAVSGTSDSLLPCSLSGASLPAGSGCRGRGRVPVRPENFEGDRLYAPSDLSLLLRIHRKPKAH